MNTDSSTLNVLLSYPAANQPSIESIDFLDEGKLKFEIKYFLTNSEENFIGYNLYIGTIPFSLENILAGSKSSIYLENGIEPSFSHANAVFSADTQEIQTRVISNKKAAPSPEPFYECLVYYFRLTAYLRGDFESEASSEVQVCASSDPSSCPSSSPCNP